MSPVDWTIQDWTMKDMIFAMAWQRQAGMQNLFNMTSKFGSGFCCAWCQGSEPSDCLGPIAPYSAHGNNSSSSRKCIAGNKGIDINWIVCIILVRFC